MFLFSWKLIFLSTVVGSPSLIRQLPLKQGLKLVQVLRPGTVLFFGLACRIYENFNERSLDFKEMCFRLLAAYDLL